MARVEPFVAADLALVNVGVALVSLALERSLGTDTARRDLRAAVFSLLVDGIPVNRLPVAGVGWDELFAGSVHLLVAEGAPATLLAVLEQVEESSPGGGWRGAVMHQDRLVVIAPAESDDDGHDDRPSGYVVGD